MLSYHFPALFGYPKKIFSTWAEQSIKKEIAEFLKIEFERKI